MFQFPLKVIKLVPVSMLYFMNIFALIADLLLCQVKLFLVSRYNSIDSFFFFGKLPFEVIDFSFEELFSITPFFKFVFELANFNL